MKINNTVIHTEVIMMKVLYCVSIIVLLACNVHCDYYHAVEIQLDRPLDNNQHLWIDQNIKAPDRWIDDTQYKEIVMGMTDNRYFFDLEIEKDTTLPNH